MALTIKSLASGQLKTASYASPPTTNTLYQAPAGTTPKAAVAKSVILVNTHSSAVTLNLYLLIGTDIHTNKSGFVPRI